LPNQVYASDIMFLTEKKNGALQLFAIIDIITKKIVGYCYLAYKQDNFPIFAQCIRNTTKNKNLLIFQSDKGFEYTDARTKKIFIDNNIFQSFADKERSWQNGTIEGFFAQLNYRINLPAL
jgi:transposase InsO family protein